MFKGISRRLFLRVSVVLGAVGIFGTFLFGKVRSAAGKYIRPPGAVEESKFLGQCIRCFLCGEICPNMAINFVGLEGNIAEWGTPYIMPREQGCMLCMKCTHVCPTGALKKVKDDMDEIFKKVNMGKAVVDKSICYSYNNRVCGFCYGACPFPDVSLKLGDWARPEVQEDKCVGCGLCEKICVQVPQAIRVIPRGAEHKRALYEKYKMPEIEEPKEMFGM